MKRTAGQILEKRGRALLRARRRALRSCDARAVHDVRVASRRLQAGLDVLAGEVPEDARRRLDRRARAIRRRLGDLRNAEVLLDLLGQFETVTADERHFVERLAHRLRRSGRAAAVPGDLPGLRKRLRAVLRDRSAGAAPSGSAAWRETARRVEAARRTARPDDPESMHRLRVAVKRYRYVLEVLAEAGTGGVGGPIRAARSVQKALGRLNDLENLARAVRREPRHPGRDPFLGRILAARDEDLARTLGPLAGFRTAFPSEDAAAHRKPPKRAPSGRAVARAPQNWSAA